MSKFIPFLVTFALRALQGKQVTVKRSGHAFEVGTFKGFTDGGSVTVEIDGAPVDVEPNRVRGYGRKAIVATLNEARAARRSGQGRGNVDVSALHIALGKPPRPSGKRKPAAKGKGKVSPKATAKARKVAQAKVSRAVKTARGKSRKAA